MSIDQTRKGSRLSLRGSFVLVLAIGTAGCAVGWVMNLPWITIGVPLAAMALHAVICGRDTARSEFADSMYFLGFLFTLISLAVSLIGFTSKVATEEILPALISSFGTAVLTTIVGLATRIYLTSLQPSADEDLIASEEALTAAANRFRQAIEDMTVSVTGQASAVGGALTTAVADVRDALAGATKETEKTLASSAAALSNELEEGAKRLRAGLESLPETIAKRGVAAAEASFTGLQEKTSQLGSSVDALGVKVRDLELPADAISRRMEPVLDAAQELLSSRTSALREISTESAALISGLREARGAGEEVVTALAQVAKHITAASRTLGEFEQLARTVSDLSEKLRDLGEQAAQLSKLARGANAESITELADFKKLTDEVRAMRERLLNEVSEADKSLRLMHTQIVSAASYVVDALEGRDRP